MQSVKKSTISAVILAALVTAVVSGLVTSLAVGWLAPKLIARLTGHPAEFNLTVDQATALQMRMQSLTDEVKALAAQYEAVAPMATSVNLTRWAGGLRKIWQPDQPAKGIVILHQGHSSLAGNDMNGHRFPTLDLVPLARRLVSSGYRVYGFEMPPLPHGEGQIERFYQPVIDLLDRISPQDLPIYMIGLSGGGWTTTVVTALDDRISLGFSVSGSLPEDVRPPESCEDWEQCNPPHDYRTLYAMAGDRLMQMYSLGEPGHFGGIEGDLGYAYVSDVNSNEHTITEWMEEYILGRIKDFEGAIGSS